MVNEYIPETDSNQWSRFEPRSLVPIILEQQLFDQVSVVNLVNVQMPEHYENRIMVERLVDGGFMPFVG